jgi:hypothetical protein
MSKAKRKAKQDKRYAYARKHMVYLFEFVCPNCNQVTTSGHYAPPSFGEPGFWACSDFAKLRIKEEK